MRIALAVKGYTPSFTTDGQWVEDVEAFVSLTDLNVFNVFTRKSDFEPWILYE